MFFCAVLSYRKYATYDRKLRLSNGKLTYFRNDVTSGRETEILMPNVTYFRQESGFY